MITEMGALDSVVVASGTEIKVSRGALVFDSAFFQRKFGANNKRVSVSIVDGSVDAFRCLLTLCQNNSREAIARRDKSLARADSSILTEAIDLAERFEFRVTRKRLLRELILRTPEKGERALCEKIWKLTPNALNLWDYLALNFNVFLKTALSDITLSKVLGSSELILSYRNVLRVIVEWKKMHPEADKAMLDTLLEHARFDCLSQEEIRVLIKSECMPHGQWLQQRIDGNRNGLVFLHMDRPDAPEYETVERIKIPDFAATLHAPNQYKGYGAARIEMPLHDKKIYDWGRDPKPSSRFFLTVGDFAVSLWFYSFDNWFFSTVVIDRRLKGNQEENLCKAVEGLSLQVFIKSQTAEYRKDDFIYTATYPAVDACRSKILSQHSREWQGTGYQIMSSEEATNLVGASRNRNTVLQSFVDIRLVKTKNGAMSNS